MLKKDVYLWFSGATDITGKKLMEELGIDGGREKPKTSKKMVIGWGAKTKDDIAFTNMEVLNHPNKIRANRNKFTTLQTLGATKNTVAPFVKATDVIQAIDDNKSPICLPLVGRTNYHQGGKGFWLCLTKSQVKSAIDEGAQYFQNYIDIVDEYRIHVFDGKTICAQKKVKRTDVEEAYVTQHAEKIGNIADKNKKKLDKATLDYALGRLAKEHSNVDMIVRSNRRGWKFSHVKKFDTGMEKLAINALKAVGLNFGAVDCCIDEAGRPWIIEINSGPGLDGTTFKAYADEFKRVIRDLEKPAPAIKPVKTAAPRATMTDFAKTGKIRSNSAKDRLDGIRNLLSVVENADEAEAAMIENLLKKELGAR